MRSVRTFRTGTIAAVIAWKLVALALLPAALCCRAVMVADGADVHACCEGGEHGAMCPMKRGGRTEEKDAAQEQPRLAACNSLDDALVGLLSLTGFTPDSFDLSVDPAAAGRVRDSRQAADSLRRHPQPAPAASLIRSLAFSFSVGAGVCCTFRWRRPGPRPV